MECMVCGSKNLIVKETVISEFLRARIGRGGVFHENPNVNLCHCKECSFSFYDRRLTEEESNRLYEGYREEEYQKIREQYDCWYTARVNNLINYNEAGLKEKRRVIEKVVKENISSEIKVALDYGGNRGEIFTDFIGTEKKYVFDISGVETLPGVENVKNYDELFGYTFDFIMCNMTLEHVSYPKDFIKLLYDIGTSNTYYYLEVPSENPFEKNKFSIAKNMSLLMNPNYSKLRLIKHYFKVRKQPYMPMHEHVNFFTPNALKTLMINCGFDVLDVQENYMKGALGKENVLSIICKKRKKK